MSITQKGIARLKSLSIIVPTYNESKNIVGVLDSLRKYLLPIDIDTKIIVIDDNSTDGTGNIVDEYAKNSKKEKSQSVQIIHRKTERGLSSAILAGIKYAKGDSVVVMDSDF